MQNCLLQEATKLHQKFLGKIAQLLGFLLALQVKQVMQQFHEFFCSHPLAGVFEVENRELEHLIDHATGDGLQQLTFLFVGILQEAGHFFLPDLLQGLLYFVDSR